MGILKDAEDFVRQLVLPDNFSVCELGDQWITHLPTRRLASELYKELGCRRYVSIDGNGRGTHKFDLNLPLPESLGRFDLVTDFGTGEHIFNQFQLWKNIHYLTRMEGGYIVFDHPTQGYPEHSFYNYHECLFRDLAEANKYDIVKLERKTTIRGELIRGIFKKNGKPKFVIPQQGRYKKALRDMHK